MKAIRWIAISFGCTLGVVVALRLNEAGLLLVATALLSAMLLCPLFALRWVVEHLEGGLQVWVEPPPAGNLGEARRTPPALTARAGGRERRGGWPHLENFLSKQEEQRGTNRAG